MKGDNSHNTFEELADKLLDGTIDDEERSLLFGHARDCQSCAEITQALPPLIEAWKTHPEDLISADLKETVGDRIIGELAMGETPGARGKGLSPFRILGLSLPIAAAAAALLLVIAQPWSPAGPRQDEPVAKAPADTEPAQKALPVSQKPASTPSLMASVLESNGRATFEREGAKPHPVITGTELAVGDKVTLEDGASAFLHLPETARVHLSKSAVLVLEKDGATGTKLHLKRGVLTTMVEPREEGEAFSVLTPAGEVEVTGTIFRVEVRSNAEARVQVAEGTVLVRDRADERNVVAVAQGNQLTLDWSNPEPASLSNSSAEEILALFDMEPDQVEIAAAPPKPHRKKAQKTDWNELFAEAQAARKSGENQECASIYRRIAAGAPSRNMRAEAAFSLGQLLFKSGSPGKAMAEFDKSRLYKGTPYAAMSLYYLVESAAKLRRCDRAAAAAQKLAMEHPGHRLTPKASATAAGCATP